MKLERRTEINNSIKNVVELSVSARKTGTEFLKLSDIINGVKMNREEMAFFLGCLTEKIGLATEEKFKFGSIITIDLR